VPETNGQNKEKRMYLNRITLIGFIGSDAERKAANSTNIAIFSLATKTSWKNDAGSWEPRTEWHRCVAFGKLADFAGTLTKGAHIAIEGELRSHEYHRELAISTHKTTLTQRVWEIGVDSVLKLDRAPPNAKPLRRIKRRCPSKGHLLSHTTGGRHPPPTALLSISQDTFMLLFPSCSDDAVRPNAPTRSRLLPKTAFAQSVCDWVCLC
jgi:single-strand DNA-binding protein